jgi:EmrB/QacA subfamily drug resistance transporter
MAALRARLGRTSPGYRLSLGRVLAVYGGLMAALLLASLEQTIVVTALPAIVTDLGGLNGYSWVVTAYVLAMTVAVPLYGKLCDVYGLRRMFGVAIGLFFAGTLACALAQNMTAFLLSRALQGLGAGGIFPLSFTAVAAVVPPRERGRYLGLIGGTFATAAIAGPTLGGVVVDGPGWRWIFFGSLPVAAGALGLVLATLPPDEPGAPQRVDWGGGALLAGGAGAFLLALVWGGREHPWESAHVVGALAASVVLLAAFALVERRVEETILPFELLRTPAIAVGVLATGLLGMAMLGTVVFVPLFVQEVLGTSATSTGVAITPFMLGAIGASVLAGQYASRTGRYRSPVVVGSAVLLVGLVLVWRLDPGSTNAEVFRDALITGVGLGLVMQLLTLSVQNLVESRVLGAATALSHFARLIGGALGVTVMGAIVSGRLPQGTTDGTPIPKHLPPALQERLAEALQPAFLTAVGFAAALLAVVLIAFREVPLRRSVDEPVSAPAPLGSEP